MTDNNQSHEIEFQLVGSVLKDGKTFQRVSDIVGKENFHNTICVDIFSAMEKLHAAGITIDQVTVGDQLTRDGKIETLNYDVFSGRSAVSKIRDMGSPRNAESYALTVQDYWGKRQALEAARTIAVWSKNGRRAADISSDGRKMLDAIDSKIGGGTSRTLDAGQAASRTYDMAVEASQGNLQYVRTGFPSLDTWFKMRAGNLTIVAGRPGTGKTALKVTIALNYAWWLFNQKKAGTILFLSMEMSAEEVTARFLSQISGIPSSRILDGEMTAEEWQRFNDAVENFEKLPIKINDLPAMTIPGIRAEARRWLADGEDNLLIVDYLQLGQSGQGKQNRTEEVGAVARGLKVYAGETKTPVLAGAQLSREIEKRGNSRPILSDLRESGNIEQDANNILFLYSDDEPRNTNGKEIRKLIVAKQRMGPTSDKKGDVEMEWDAPIMRFDEIGKQTIKFS